MLFRKQLGIMMGFFSLQTQETKITKQYNEILIIMSRETEFIVRSLLLWLENKAAFRLSLKQNILACLAIPLV